MEWGDKGCEYRPSRCEHEPDDGCMWCCMRCNTDMHYCPGCGAIADHKNSVCPDCLASFVVHADWCNDGSAELSMQHKPCGWFLDNDAVPGMTAERVNGIPLNHPSEGSAPLSALLVAALEHTCETP